MQLILEEIVEYFRRPEYSITTHGYEELDNDGITIVELETAIGQDNPEVIEDYPNDRRGPSCLVLGWSSPQTPVHVVLGIAMDAPLVVTAYRPNSNRFRPPEFRERIR